MKSGGKRVRLKVLEKRLGLTAVASEVIVALLANNNTKAKRQLTRKKLETIAMDLSNFGFCLEAVCFFPLFLLGE